LRLQRPVHSDAMVAYRYRESDVVIGGANIDLATVWTEFQRVMEEIPEHLTQSQPIGKNGYTSRAQFRNDRHVFSVSDSLVRFNRVLKYFVHVDPIEPHVELVLPNLREIE